MVRGPRSPLIRAGDRGRTRSSLARAAADATLERVERGVYRVPAAQRHRFEAFAIATRVRPQAIVCLLSALAFHELTTEEPHDLWLAVPRGVRPPTLSTVEVRAISVAKPLFDVGLETARILGTDVRVTGVARTVLDCFRFRRLVGLETALTALREAVAERRATPAELGRMARRMRIVTVVAPYLAAMI